MGTRLKLGVCYKYINSKWALLGAWRRGGSFFPVLQGTQKSEQMHSGTLIILLYSQVGLTTRE